MCNVMLVKILIVNLRIFEYIGSDFNCLKFRLQKKKSGCELQEKHVGYSERAKKPYDLNKLTPSVLDFH